MAGTGDGTDGWSLDIGLVAGPGASVSSSGNRWDGEAVDASVPLSGTPVDCSGETPRCGVDDGW